MREAVLVGCEESQVVCRSFRAAGYEAYSCDLQATRGNPAWHMQCDVLEAVASRVWALIILHPDCTKMAVSGNRWYGRGTARHRERLAQVAWTIKLWELAKQNGERVALENPNSVIFPELRREGAQVQYIQPHQYGHGETKRTGLALHRLPELKATNNVPGREARVWKMPPGKHRKRDRSTAYQGIADAMVAQWGPLIARPTPDEGERGGPASDFAPWHIRNAG